MALDGLTFLIVPLIWSIPAVLLYVIVRFGVKHGMRSYYAEVARSSSPPAGPSGKPLP